jgi:hypothetical protein
VRQGGTLRAALWQAWTALFWRILAALVRNGGRRQRGRRRVLRIRTPLSVSPETAERIRTLLELQEALGDWKALSDLGNGTREKESSFHIEPEDAVAIARRILELDLPFLDLGGVLPEGAQGERVEVVERLAPELVEERITILCPEVATVESRWRHGELSYRPADAIADLYRLPLHERALPPALLIELLMKGELYVPGRGHKPTLEFVPCEVSLPVERLVSRPVVCRLPQADSSEQKRIVYFLIDTSQSMRGPLAVLAAGIVRAVVLANLGRPRVYYARAFAADVEPAADQPPREARATTERVELADWIMSQSFGGPETRLMQAIEICLRDIRRAKQHADQEDLPAAEVLLISDGRSSLLPYVQEDIRQSGIKLHVVSLGAHRNAELEALAESYSMILDAHSLQVGAVPVTRPAAVGPFLSPGTAGPRPASPAPSR